MKAKVESLGKIFHVRNSITTVVEVNTKKVSDTEFELDVKSHRVITVKIPCEMYEQLNKIAKERGVTLSEVVRKALSEHLQKVSSEKK